VELCETATSAAYLLQWLCEDEPGLLTDIAQKMVSWPVMYGPHRDLRNRVTELLRELKLGAKTNINYSSGKSYSHELPANNFALYLYDLAKHLQHAPIRDWDDYGYLLLDGRFFNGTADSDQPVISDPKQLRALETWGQEGAGSVLPPLLKSTASAWKAAIPDLFRMVYGKKFDEHPVLQELRASVSGERNADREPGGGGTIRAAMLRKVKQAFTSIAALD